MRHRILLALSLGGLIILSACAKTSTEAEVDRAVKGLNVIDESNLNDIMLSAADPNEAVAYFTRTVAENPERIDVMRGLGASLVRAKQPKEASVVWAQVVLHPDATNDDRISYADSLIRLGDWDAAEAALDAVPPTYETYQRYRLEAMVADGNEE
ncbi:MAG: hypothetical protein ACC619_04835, partial [Paracoccaceae bacterium]